MYLAWLAAYFATGHDIWTLVDIGKTLDPGSPHALRGTGYDGQWYFHIAVDPLHAARMLDFPAYRYLRIVYPLLAGALAGGQVNLVPYTLLLINLVAIFGGTLCVAIWLGRRGQSPWVALVYGLFPGLFAGVVRDVSDPLAFGLVALAVLLLDRRVYLAACCFAVATLTRESTFVFPLVYGVWMLTARPRTVESTRRAFAVLAVGLMPIAAYKLFLWFWLGSAGAPAKALPVIVPLLGIASWWPWGGDQVIAAISDVIPAAICTVVAVRLVARRALSPEVALLLLNCMLFVFFLNSASYADMFGSLRVTTGVVLSAIMCLPLSRQVLRSEKWFWSCVPCWLLMAPSMFVLLPIWTIFQ